MTLSKLKLSTCFWLASIALALAALTPTLHLSQIHLTGDASPTIQRSHSDAGGQTASPNPGNSGFDQEERVRQMLVKQYEQRFGTSDEAIRSALGIKGKVADFVGYNAKQNRWLIAESKASDIDTAVKQLQNTAEALLRMHPGAKIELRLFLDSKNIKLLEDSGEVYGWRMTAQGHLGWIDRDTTRWVDALIEGVKIAVQVAP